MHKNLSTTCLSLLLAWAASTAHAEMAVGGFSFAPNPGHPIRFFSANAQGGDAPIGLIDGPDTQLETPSFGIYEPQEQVIYVSDFFGQALRVYPAFTRGNVAPIRVLNPPLLSQTRASAPIPAHGELAVIAGNCCIDIYPLQASGSGAIRLRGIAWGGGSSGSATELDNPQALHYLPATDELVVVDSNRVLFHARTAGWYDAPTRRITGAFVQGASGLAHDPVAHRLFVLTQEPYDGSQSVLHGRIAVFDESASGEATPLYTIEGSNSELDRPPGEYFYGIGFDPYLRRLMVSSSGSSNNPALNRLVVFDATASGNATPLQQLAGSNVSAYTVGTPFGVPPERIFADGFDP